MHNVRMRGIYIEKQLIFYMWKYRNWEMHEYIANLNGGISTPIPTYIFFTK